MRPSLRRLELRRSARAPASAIGFPRVTSGGQYAAQSPLHVLFDDLSCAHMYSVLPWESTRTRPRLLRPSFTTVPLSADPTAETARAAAAASTIAEITRCLKYCI